MTQFASATFDVVLPNPLLVVTCPVLVSKTTLFVPTPVLRVLPKLMPVLVVRPLLKLVVVRPLLRVVPKPTTLLLRRLLVPMRPVLTVG